MHSQLAKILFWSGARYRNPSLRAEYRRLKESEWQSRAELRDLQLERAARFFRFVAQHSPYYRRVFAGCGFSADRFASVADLAVIPITEKRDLITHNRDIHTQFEFPRAFTAETSGTSGTALEFRKDERWDSINRASMMRSYDWFGVKPWDRSGYLWGYDIAPERARKVRVMDALQNRFRIFSYDKPAIRAFAAALQSATYIGGYSSMIYETARLINELNLEKPQLKMVKGTSEMILDVYQSAAQRAFGTRIVSEYGAAESGLIAFECPSGRMHINVEDVIVELDQGDIIVTNLASYSFPVIRYRLGDQVVLSDDACPCGRAHPLIGEIMGRKGASVIGTTGRYPALTFYYVFKNIALRQSVLLDYRAVQDAVGVVNIEIRDEQNRQHEHLVRAELDKYFADDVTAHIRFVAEFQRGARKKPQYFESRIPN